MATVQGKSGVVDAVREYQWSRSRGMPLTEGQKMRIAPNQVYHPIM
jgi:hypothetical protein